MTCDAPFLYERWMLSLLGLFGRKSGTWVVGLTKGCTSGNEASGGDDGSGPFGCIFVSIVPSARKNWDLEVPRADNGGDGMTEDSCWHYAC